MSIVATNASLLEMTKNDLQMEYETLKKLHDQATNDIETKNQQLHNYEREVNRLTSLEREYQQEIELLQSAEKNACKRLEMKVQTLEEYIQNLKQSSTEQIDLLKWQLDEKTVQLELQSNLQSVKAASEADDASELEDLKAENVDLKDHVCELSEKVEELKDTVEGLEQQNLSVHQIITNLQCEATSLQESYKCKEEELHEAKKLMQSLQEEHIVTKTELDLLKAKPLDCKSQGNSLFAEVNDSRLQLQQAMLDMKTRYKEMHKEKSQHLRQIYDLQSEVAMLCKRWDEELEEKEDEKDEQQYMYRTRIDTLESLVAAYEKELSERQKLSAKDLDDCVLNFMETMTNNKNREIEKHLQRINQLSVSESLIGRRLRDANVEMRKWRTSSTKLQCEVGQLKAEVVQMKAEIENLKVQKSDESVKAKEQPEIPTIATQPSVLRNVMRELTAGLAHEDSNKENARFSNVNVSRLSKKASCSSEEARNDKKSLDCNVKSEVDDGKDVRKKVQFSEDTVEPNVTNRNRLRRGGKIIQVNSIHVPSIKKKYM